MTIKLSDYVMRRIADAGVRHLFMITGGGAMHLNDSAGQEKRLALVYNHHEQASAMAAEAYARLKGGLGALCVTTGPGGVNALNGVLGAWTDSIPMLVISGQVKLATCMASYRVAGLRQLGDQEADIVGMVRGITKYAVLIQDPRSIRYHLERAMALAVSGRPGPCWLDIPIDLQSAMVDEESLLPYDPREDAPSSAPETLPALCRTVLTRLETSARPVILAGSGVHLAGALELFREVIGLLGVPVTTGWTAPDLVASDDPRYCGRPGTVGDRAGNFTVQSADTLLVLGCRLNIRQVSYSWGSFARRAFKIQVDADRAELTKPTVRPDLPVHCDLRLFLEELRTQLRAAPATPGRHAAWLAWCRERVQRYPVYSRERHVSRDGAINPYHFLDALLGRLADDDAIVCGNGTASVVTFQVAQVKAGQRYIANSGSASMGYDLPAAIGAAFARGGRRVICIAGDGSLQMNAQELQTVAHYRLPLKIVVLNNRGYLSIRSTQQAFFGRLVGEGPESGLTLPDYVSVARGYGLDAFRIERAAFDSDLRRLLAAPGPVLCEVMLDPEQLFEPRSKARELPDGTIVSPPLEDLYPFLSREELASNLIEDPPASAHGR